MQGGTWVTAQAVTLACVRGIDDESVHASVDWLLRVVGAEHSLGMRAASHLHLLKTKLDVSHEGWPWRDGNAAWIEPTSHTLVALKKFASNYRRPEKNYRIREGEALLFGRRCSDGGWNCGNPNVLNFDLPSYPETTALALLGLQGRSQQELASPLAVARRLRQDTKSTLAKAWLAIALRCYNQDLEAPVSSPVTNDMMLTALEALGHPTGNFALLRTGANA